MRNNFEIKKDHFGSNVINDLFFIHSTILLLTNFEVMYQPVVIQTLNVLFQTKVFFYNIDSQYVIPSLLQSDRFLVIKIQLKLPHSLTQSLSLSLSHSLNLSFSFSLSLSFSFSLSLSHSLFRLFRERKNKFPKV
jgi:hypothetical protein